MFEKRLITCALLILAFPVCNGGFPATLFQSYRNRSEDQASSEERELARLRERMVRLQLQGRDITDTRVLDAMLKVPRHLFLSRDLRALAYNDGALPIRHGQTISQPYIVAFMTQLLELKGTERVLEIGTGSGYQAAVLAEIVREVYTVEIVPELGHEAEAVLKSLGYKNIQFRIGDGYDGWSEHAPFDRIIVTAAPGDIPPPLIRQLERGGRLICPVGEMNQELVVLVKEASGITRRNTIPVRFVPMTGKAQEP
jgi:protein-L-isoaspartate(D-aspartate) O-methyltransferase